MPETPKPEFFCSVCKTGLSEDDILDGLAIRRFDRIYCIEHFREQYPDECENHPGSLAYVKCSHCGLRFCDNCTIELLGEKICYRCKRAKLEQLRTGNQTDAEDIYRRKSSLPTYILVLSILGISVCSVLNLVVIILYVIYRRQVKKGEVLQSKMATIGLIISILGISCSVIIMIIIFLSTAM